MQSNDKPQTFAERAALGLTAGDKGRTGAQVDQTPESPLDRRNGPGTIQTAGDMLVLLTWAAGVDRIQRGQLEAEAWLAILQGLQIEAVRRAITAHYRRSRFPVTPADIIEELEERNPGW